MACRSEHRYLPSLENLPDSQAGEGRHKCAGCAYEQGYNHGYEGYVEKLDVSLLEDSQAGTGRHKDVEAAYSLGYKYGSLRRR